MMSEYIEPISLQHDFETQPEVKPNEQKTPKRITIKYQTTGIFEDISKEKPNMSGEDIPR